MIVRLPSDAMVVLVGPSGSGKSTFAVRHFQPTQVLSSDALRAMVADDAYDHTATDAAFELLHTALAKPAAIRRQHVRMRASLDRLAAEGFNPLAVLSTAEEIEAAVVEQVPA